MTNKIPAIYGDRQTSTELARGASVAPTSPSWYDFRGRRERHDANAQMNSIAIRGAVRAFEHQVETVVQDLILENEVAASERQTEKLAQLHGSNMRAVQEISDRFATAAEASYRKEAAHRLAILGEVATGSLSTEVADLVLNVRHYADERVRMLQDRATTSCLEVKMKSFEWVANSRVGPSRD